METVQQNGRFTLFSSKFHFNIYSILFDSKLKSSRIILSNQPSKDDNARGSEQLA